MSIDFSVFSAGSEKGENEFDMFFILNNRKITVLKNKRILVDRNFSPGARNEKIQTLFERVKKTKQMNTRPGTIEMFDARIIGPESFQKSHVV